ncbi:MAG: Hsp70 family protein [Terriglobales bacterium]|jgi:molecular chaperone DnaK
MSDPIVGIDLGTTNSEVAAFSDGKVQVLNAGKSKLLPSVVGLSPSGELLVGEAARNQLVLYPERTVRSIKRKMGSSETVSLGERQFAPQEISALILRELATWAGRQLQQTVEKAVITVPAYFSDAQRQATREAAQLAGLEAVRILNEPTAASLAYGEGSRHNALVYDLGGGTFDVSIVALEGDITEVLASHGNNRLGGDDFNDLLAEHLLSTFQRNHGIDLRSEHHVARARLWWAAEDAKRRLSFEPETTVREEALVTVDGKPLHLELEITRERYESMIRPLLEQTFESVSKALADARKSPSDLDAILLVGGSTRTPLIAEMLRERTGITPREDIHPDLCVALGAGVLASRLGGHDVERVLVDVSPYSFGVSYLGERGGIVYPHCYKPILRRNSPLPITRTERFYTSHPYQEEVNICVYEGEDEDALRDILVGDFQVKGLTPVREQNEVLCRMSLDLDGILHVTAIEKRSGLSKHITIARALESKSQAEIAAARQRLEALYSVGQSDLEDVEEEGEGLEDMVNEDLLEPLPLSLDSRAEKNDWSVAIGEGKQLIERSRQLLAELHEEDREEAIELNAQIESAIDSNDEAALRQAANDLRELLFFVEGRA